MTAEQFPPRTAMSLPAKGILLMLAGIMVFTLMDATAKHLNPSYPSLQIVWARYAGQTVLVLILVAHRMPAVLRTRHPVVQGLRSLFQFGATAMFFLSLGYIGLAEATAIMDVNPVLITLGAALILGEKIGPRRAAGIAAALIGAIIIIRPGFGVFSPAALLPLGAALCYAGTAITTRWIGGRDGIWTSLVYAALPGTIITTALMPFIWQPIASGDIGWFLAIGVMGMAAQGLVIRAFSVAEAGLLAPFGYIGLMFATLWGLLFFGEVPDGLTILGALVIVGAGLYVWHRETRIGKHAE
jgi:drug/metabolite transporter (DMT)-like permease